VVIEPDELAFYKLIRLYDETIWTKRQKKEWTEWLHAVRERRNAIHSYKDSDIATWDAWEQSLQGYLCLLRELDGQVPYP
jgi:hypothetical protein